ncbi:MAG: hypothetical protein K0R17_899 [Rariglobus sp.]|nr:hypothetical protein [Rariglobus sp.]
MYLLTNTHHPPIFPDSKLVAKGGEVVPEKFLGECAGFRVEIRAIITVARGRVDHRQDHPGLFNDITDVVVARLQVFIANYEINDEPALSVHHNGRLLAREMTKVTPFARRVVQNVLKGPVARGGQEFPAGDEPIEGISDRCEFVIPGKGIVEGVIFRAEVSVVEQVPVRILPI